MWSFTSEVSTVPGPVAAYQPSALNPGDATSAPACGTLAASCNCQPDDTTTRSGNPRSGMLFCAAPRTGARANDIDTTARKKESPNRLCKGASSVLRLCFESL